MDISIVIPAYNEEKFIGTTITSIQQWMPSIYSYEIIVVNHGSADDTAKIAEQAGAIVVDGKSMKTIAALRNLGVSQSSGQLLFFIDADITFTQQWSENIEPVIESLKVEPNQICGSLPAIPEDSSIMMKLWFSPRSMESKPKYIGSCHLLTSKKLFSEIGGFPEELETAEEFNFCQNATKKGATLTASPELVVVHHGTPNTVFEFAKREVWHGRGDWTNVSSILSSKVAILSLFFIVAHLGLVISAFNQSITTVYLMAFTIVFICFFSSFIKFSKHGIQYVVINATTYYVYFFARALSLGSALFSKKFKKRSRSN